MKRIRTEVLSACLADNSKAWEIQPDGTHRRITPSDGAPEIATQEVLMRVAHGEALEIPDHFPQAAVD